VNEPASFDGGRFTVRRRLGAGAFGVVYEVDDAEWGEPVALKLLRHADAPLLHRFKKEFRAFVDLEHPQLVSLYELVARDDRWFFTMELVDGSGLVDFVAGDLARLRAAMRQLAEGVAALHRLGKLHRDLKPSNVLVTADGRVKICDAGLVTATDEERQTRSRHAKGTPVFMSPEQAANRPLSTASDWYSLGAILYLALTGQAPFSGSDLVVMRDKQLREPPPPGALADVPAELDELCVRLLQRAPERRPSSDEILGRLGAPARREPPASLRPSAFEPLDAALSASGSRLIVARGERALVPRLAAQAAARGARVLVTTCRECESIPHRAIDGLFEAPPADGASVAERLRALLGRPDDGRRLVVCFGALDAGDAESAELVGAALRAGPSPLVIIAGLGYDGELPPAWHAALGALPSAELSSIGDEDDDAWDGISHDARSLLRLVAVAERPLARPVLAASARGLVGRLPSAWAELTRRRLVQKGADGRWRLAHERVRRQVIESLTRAELEGCRRRLARQLS
jgi:hypothetical protein